MPYLNERQGRLREGRSVQVPGNEWFVNAASGSNGNDGRSWQSAFLTMATALSRAANGDRIYFVGNVREQITASNLLFDISIIGAGNRPRHADGTGTSAATWKLPASPTAATPLLIIRGQGWHLENILFDGPADAAAVKLERNALSGASEYDASHAALVGCRFDTGMTGIEDAGGHFNVLVEDCFFRGITDSTGRAIYCSSTAVANPLNWQIRNCRFMDNDNHIVAAASGWVVAESIFSALNVTDKINFTGGVAGNIITRNTFAGTYSIAGGYTGAGAGDEWGGNFNVLSGGVTAADPA